VTDDLLDRIRTELEQRLEESRAARDEYARLERALAALDAVESDGQARASTPSRRARRGSNGTRSRPRAPRGQNRERVLAAVRERPGASPAEIALASGVERGVLYALLTRLVGSGALEKEQLPGGGTGYSLPTGER
jgi:hypothetical protein